MRSGHVRRGRRANRRDRGRRRQLRRDARGEPAAAVGRASRARSRRAPPVAYGSGAARPGERVLQWTPDPGAALAELHRATAPGGWTAVTDTDWGTLTVDHRDPSATERLAAAALRWVPHPRFAYGLPEAMTALGVTQVRVRTDTVVVTAWDPDDPTQRDGPPGLPLRSIAVAAEECDRGALERDLRVLADEARGGGFHATLVLVTVAARR